jgi:hypothetical protein
VRHHALVGSQDPADTLPLLVGEPVAVLTDGVVVARFHLGVFGVGEAAAAGCCGAAETAGRAAPRRAARPNLRRETSRLVSLIPTVYCERLGAKPAFLLPRFGRGGYRFGEVDFLVQAGEGE